MRIMPLSLACCFTLLLLFQSAQQHAEAETVSAEQAFQTITLTGFTRARKVLRVSSEIAGKVEQVYAELGDVIPDTGLFACLDRTFIDLELDSNRSEQRRINAEIAYYEKQRDRFRRLVKTNSSAQSQLDEAERSLAVFQQQLTTQRIHAQNLTERRQRHCLRAPAGWQVMQREVEVYQWINVGQTVAEIGDFSTLLIPFAFTQQEFNALQLAGDELVLNFPDLNQSCPARITHIAPGFDQDSMKIQVNLEVDSSSLVKRGGLRAELDLSLPDASGAFLIQQSALQQRYEEYWLTRESGEEIRVVYLGGKQQGQNRLARVVSEQIQAGDKFLLNGN